ncbi:hypothetical protein MBLNU230_g6685t1 [Neophaeotheca triangularis]
MAPEIIHHPLARADGSAKFTDNLFTVLAAVNGPIEVQRRDELPEEAAIEVNIRPVSGVGSPRERWLESIIHATLRSFILVHLHPRTLVQVTLQISKEPAMKLKPATQDVAVLPALLNAAFFALVDSGAPLSATVNATLGAVVSGSGAKMQPSEKNLAAAKSVHAMAYNHLGELLLNESAGEFDILLWEQVESLAQEACLAAMARDTEDETMEGSAESAPWVRQTLQAKAEKDNAWKETT